jgi:hypothetical protein
LLPFKKSIFVVLVSLSASLLTSCSDQSSTQTIRATLFLLDASKSMFLTVEKREQQLRERLAGAFSKDEAIYFDFIRNNLSKQVILPLVPMQTMMLIMKEDKMRQGKKFPSCGQVRSVIREL